MAVLGFASGSDRHKPDSTGTRENGDWMKFTTGATIQTTALLAPGSTKIRCDLSVAKQLAEAQLFFTSAGSAVNSTAEYCVTHIVKQTAASNVNAHTIIRTNTNTATRFALWSVLVGGVTVWQVKYDNVQIGANFTPTINNVYRIGIYLKLGTLGSANSTVKVYIDDVTGGTDIAVGAATLVISSTTVTMTNAPTAGSVILGMQANVSGSGAIYEYQHLVVMDTSGSLNNNPAARVLDPICVTERSLPTGAGNYAEASSGTYADVDEVPPDEGTTVVSAVLTSAARVKRVSYDMTAWASVGGSTTDTLLAVRNMWRTDAAVSPGYETLLRSSTTDSYGTGRRDTGGSGYKTWTYIYESDPNTSAAWTLTAYDAAEAGGRFSWAAVDETGAATLIGLDGVFIRPAAATGRRRFAGTVI